jgi:hypothetical protein
VGHCSLSEVHLILTYKTFRELALFLSSGIGCHYTDRFYPFFVFGVGGGIGDPT